MVTNTITFCYTRAFGMQIQRDTINNHKRKKKGNKENRAPFLISVGMCWLTPDSWRHFSSLLGLQSPHPVQGEGGRKKMDLAGHCLPEQLWMGTAWLQVPSVCVEPVVKDQTLPLIYFKPVSSSAAQVLHFQAIKAKLLVGFWEPSSSFSYNSSISKLLLGKSGILLPPTLLTPAGH